MSASRSGRHKGEEYFLGVTARIVSVVRYGCPGSSQWTALDFLIDINALCGIINNPRLSQ
jgi:hypothetical protein